MNAADLIPVLLLLLFGVGVTVAAGLILLMVRILRTRQAEPLSLPSWPSLATYEGAGYSRRPGCWLVVKSKNLVAVQSALGLHNARPCSLAEGLAGGKLLFIAPPVHGWILVTGDGLPDPSENVDACFRMLLDLSQKLGQVQFFKACRILNHHAWARIENGRVVRAYAWAGTTIWNQGVRTHAERELGLVCYDYGESVERDDFLETDGVVPNVEKTPLLAARWSLDPARIEERFLEDECGVSGELSRRY